jgi:hypothetical protein
MSDAVCKYGSPVVGSDETSIKWFLLKSNTVPKLAGSNTATLMKYPSIENFPT